MPGMKSGRRHVTLMPTKVFSYQKLNQSPFMVRKQNAHLVTLQGDQKVCPECYRVVTVKERADWITHAGRPDQIERSRMPRWQRHSHCPLGGQPYEPPAPEQQV